MSSARTGRGEAERSRELPLAAFELLVPLGTAGQAGRWPRTVTVCSSPCELDVLAAEAGQLDGQHVAIGQLRQIHRRDPAGRRATEQALETLLHGEQVARRVPGHTFPSYRRIRACWRRPARAVTWGVLVTHEFHDLWARFKRRGSARACSSTIEGGLFRILDLHHITPGNKRGHVQCQLRDIRSNRLTDIKFRSEDDVERRGSTSRRCSSSTATATVYYFMNTASYEQVHLSQDVLGDSALYLLPESLINVEFYETEPVGIHLPTTVDLKVTDTVPGIKGATAAAQVKPATLETGLVVNVPAFVNTGDVVRINTETGEYLSRA